MLIRNNDGEVVGETKRFDHSRGHRDSDEHDVPERASSHPKYLDPRQSGKRAHDEYNRRKDSALIRVQRPGSQDEHNRREAIWDINLRPTRQGVCHRD